MKKRNVVKRLAAAMFAAATIVSGLSVTALAEGELPTIDSNRTVSLTITKHIGDSTGLGPNDSVTGKLDSTVTGTALQGVSFTALKVADLEQNVATSDGTNGSISLAYKLTADGAAILNSGTTNTTDTTPYNVGDIVTGDTLNTFIANKKATDFTATQLTNGVTATTGAEGKVQFTSYSNVTTSDSVKAISEQGLYLVVETAAPSTVTKRSHPFFASLPMTDKENENDWQYDVYAYPKNSTGSTNVDKKITAVNNDETNGIATGNKSAEAQIGDIITYQVPVTAVVPDGGLTKLGITDTMSKGLTFQTAVDEAAAGDVEVYTGSTVDAAKKIDPSNNYYTVVADKNTTTGVTTLTVYFTDAYLDTLNAGADKNPSFLFVYRAKLNEDAVVGKTGNDNSVKFIYNYTNGPTNDIESTEKKTKVYTWGIEVTKTGEKSALLPNVEFTLTKKGAGSAADTELKFVEKTSGSGVYVPSGDTSANKTIKTNANGKLTIKGLESGTYELTETKTASGYVLLKAPVTIVITGSNTDGSATATVSGKPATMLKDGTSESALVPVTVVNNKGFSLPVTGDAGTALFTIIGIAASVVAAALLLMRRKRAER